MSARPALPNHVVFRSCLTTDDSAGRIRVDLPSSATRACPQARHHRASRKARRASEGYAKIPGITYTAVSTIGRAVIDMVEYYDVRSQLGECIQQLRETVGASVIYGDDDNVPERLPVERIRSPPRPSPQHCKLESQTATVGFFISLRRRRPMCLPGTTCESCGLFHFFDADCRAKVVS